MGVKKIIIASLIFYLIIAFVLIEYNTPLPNSQTIKNLGKINSIFISFSYDNRTTTFYIDNYLLVFSYGELKDWLSVNGSAYKCESLDRRKINGSLENIEKELPNLFSFRRSIPNVNYSLKLSTLSISSTNGFLGYLATILFGGVYDEKDRIIPISTYVEINETALSDIFRDLLSLGDECKNKANLCVVYITSFSNTTYCGDVFYPNLCGKYLVENGSYFIDCNGKYFFLTKPLENVQEGDFVEFSSARVKNSTIISYFSFSSSYSPCDYYCL